VNGNLTSAGSVTVNAGGTLGGTGTVGNTTINAGGALAPGNSIGTINISGNLSFVGAGNYVVEVNGAASDKTVVTGTATLGGTVQVVPLARLTTRTTYTILSGVPVSGTFGSAAVVNNFARNPLLSYVGNDVLLTLDPGLLSPALIGGTPNQRSVAAGIDNAITAGNPLSGFDPLFGLSAAALPGALDQLSGEVHASTAGALVDESQYVRSAILGRLRKASYGGDASMASLTMGGPQTAFADEALETALAYAKSPIVTKAPVRALQATSDIVFWSQGFGAWGKFNSDGNAATLSRDLAGFITGFDARFGNWRGGIAAGYTGSRNNTDGRGSANVDTGHIATYGGVSVGALQLRAGGAYAFHTIDTDRTIAFPGFFDRATAHYQGGTGQIFGEAGYGLAFGKLAVEPFAGAAWVRLDTDGFSEKGGAAALNVAANTFEVGYSTLGVRAASLIPLDNGMVVVPRASAAWQHAFNSVTPEAVLAFAAAPANTFTIAGVPIARDSLLAEAGLDLVLNAHATVGVSYTGQIASNVTDHAAKGKFSWKF
jgi:outer membrane autotransporter protein